MARRDDRAAEWTAPPTDIIQPMPEGSVWWALAYRDDRVVGAVWIADRPVVPRAGILNVMEPDEAFQDDLGLVALAIRNADDLDPIDWLSHLAATRDGDAGRVAIGEANKSIGLDGARAALGWT